MKPTKTLISHELHNQQCTVKANISMEIYILKYSLWGQKSKHVYEGKANHK